GVVGPAELEEQLDVVAAPPTNARFSPSQRGGLLVRLGEPLASCRRVSAGQRDESQDRHVLRRVERELLSSQLECSLRMLPGELELASMDGNQRDRKVVLRHLEPVLDRDVVGSGGVVGGNLPASGPELDPGQAPERAGAAWLVALAPFLMLALEEVAGIVSARGWREGARDGERGLLHQSLAAESARKVVHLRW